MSGSFKRQVCDMEAVITLKDPFELFCKELLDHVSGRSHSFIRLKSRFRNILYMHQDRSALTDAHPNQAAARKADVSMLQAAARESDASTFQSGTRKTDIHPFSPGIQEAAARRLLEKYGDSILRLSFSYVHNKEDAEEILQDTLIRVLRKHPEFKSPVQEKAYLLRTAANLSKNRIDYNRIRETDELNEELTAEGNEDLSFVWQAVKSLPERYREVIHLFYQEGYAVREIADILERNESTVRSDLRRGREKLKEILREEYDYE